MVPLGFGQLHFFEVHILEAGVAIGRLDLDKHERHHQHDSGIDISTEAMSRHHRGLALIGEIEKYDGRQPQQRQLRSRTRAKSQRHPDPPAKPTEQFRRRRLGYQDCVEDPHDPADVTNLDDLRDVTAPVIVEVARSADCPFSSKLRATAKDRFIKGDVPRIGGENEVGADPEQKKQQKYGRISAAPRWLGHRPQQF